MKDPASAATVGRNIRRLREASSVSQLDLAMKAGVSQRTICYVESGKGLTVRSLCAIADALGVTANDLVTPPAAEAVSA